MWVLIKNLCLSLLAINSSSLDQAVSGGPYSSIPDGDTGKIIRFYEDWRNYLHLSWGTLHAVAGFFQNVIVQTIFHINESFEKIFDAMFGLLGWDGTLSSSGSPLHGLYVVVSAIGWSLLVLAIILVAMQTMGHASKWSKILPNIVMVSITLTILPMMMRVAGGNSTIPGFGDIAISARSDINRASNKGMSEDLAVQPIKNNVIDLSTLIRKDWGNYQYKPDSSKIKNVANWNVLDNDDDIENMDLGDFMDEPTMKGLGLDKKHKDAEAVMNYHLVDEHEQADGGYSIEKNDYHKFAKWMNSYYSRYSVNWLGLIGQSLILGIVLIVASFRVAKDIYELSLMNLAAPFIAAQSVRSSKKWRDFLSSLVGWFLSLVLLVLIIKVYFIFINVTPTKLPDNLNWIERSLAIAIIYAAGGYAAFAGISYFERVTGVSQGLSEEAGQLMATGAMAGAVGGLAMRSTGKGVSMLGGMLNKSNAHGITNNSSKSHGTDKATGLSDTNNTDSSQIGSFANSTNNSASNNTGFSTSDAQSQNTATGLSENQSSNSAQSNSNSTGQSDSTNTATGQSQSNGYDTNTSTSNGQTNNQGNSSNTSHGQSSSYGQANNSSYGNSQSSDNYEGNSQGSSSSYNTNSTAAPDTVDNPANEGLVDNGQAVDGQDQQSAGINFDDPDTTGANASFADQADQMNNADSTANVDPSTPSQEAANNGLQDSSNWDSLLGNEPADGNFQQQADQMNNENEVSSNTVGINDAQNSQWADQMNQSPTMDPNDPNIANNDFSKQVNNPNVSNDQFNSHYGTNSSQNDTFNRNIPGTNINPQNNYDEGSVHSDYYDNTAHTNVALTTTHSSPTPPPAVTRPGKVERFGQHVTHLSKGVEQRSASYLKNRQFNLSQSGHIHGRESDPFDDE